MNNLDDGIVLISSINWKTVFGGLWKSKLVRRRPTPCNGVSSDNTRDKIEQIILLEAIRCTRELPLPLCSDLGKMLEPNRTTTNKTAAHLCIFLQDEWLPSIEFREELNYTFLE